MIIKSGNKLSWYESEVEPPLNVNGPKIWFRPSDNAHFCRDDENQKWTQYNPVNIVAKLKVGQAITIIIPPVQKP